AFATTVGLLVAQTNIWLAIAVLILWLASLWLSRPEPAPPPRPADEGSVTRQAMVELVEPFSVPVLMLDAQRIAAANA
ncbi:hypothetical protein ABTL55_19860, partial [Acinetobacter baumannii]